MPLKSTIFALSLHPAIASGQAHNLSKVKCLSHAKCLSQASLKRKACPIPNTFLQYCENCRSASPPALFPGLSKAEGTHPARNNRTASLKHSLHRGLLLIARLWWPEGLVLLAPRDLKNQKDSSGQNTTPTTLHKQQTETSLIRT